MLVYLPVVQLLNLLTVYMAYHTDQLLSCLCAVFDRVTDHAGSSLQTTNDSSASLYSLLLAQTQY